MLYAYTHAYTTLSLSLDTFFALIVGAAHSFSGFVEHNGPSSRPLMTNKIQVPRAALEGTLEAQR